MNFSYHPFPQINPFFILGTAFLMDLIIGDPVYKLHPVRLIGKLIDYLYKLLKDITINKRFLGTILAMSVLLNSLLFYMLISYILGPFRLLFDIFLCYSLMAFKDLFDHIQPVIIALDKGDMEGAKKYLSRVVARDTKRLDRDGIIRASLETLAEGFVDGFLSPTFWFFVGALFGLPIVFMLLCKIINTLDSMLGYKSPEFMDIGFASAKLDDAINFFPARISLFILTVGAILSGFNVKRALYIAIKDRLNHSSPNSAHPEAFVAGALGIRLGGPTHYLYGVVEKPWIGDNEKDPDSSDVIKGMRLIKVSGLISVLLLFIISLLL